MTDRDYIRQQLDKGGPVYFYNSTRWRKLRAEVLREDRHECQICKARGKYTRATHVHHEMHLDKHPELGLTKVLPGGRRVLISVCQACHETDCHPDRRSGHGLDRPEPVTEERWD